MRINMTQYENTPPPSKEDFLRLLQSDEFNQFEPRLDTVNIFEMAGLSSQETKHSKFLSELLNPNSALGIGDIVLKALVRAAFIAIGDKKHNTLKPIEFELSGHDNLEVRLEYKDIDILIINHSSPEYCIVLENKINANESKEQLQKYRSAVDNEFPEYEKIFIFLTPDEREPIYDKDWIAVGYKSILEGLSRALTSDNISPDVRILLKHYHSLLETHVVENIELKGIADAIYKKHKAALDYILECRPDFISDLSNHLQSSISTDDTLMKLGIKPTVSAKKYVRFTTDGMRTVSQSIPGTSWKSSTDLLVFEIVLYDQYASLKIVVGGSNNGLARETIVAQLNAVFNKGATGTSYATVFNQRLHVYSKKTDEDDHVERTSASILARAVSEVKKLLDDSVSPGLDNLLVKTLGDIMPSA